MLTTKRKFKQGDKVPFHSHPNEQSGYVISGKYIIEFGEIKEIVKVRR